MVHTLAVAAMTLEPFPEPDSVTLLGGFDLRAGGASISLPVGSQQLVAFLAVQGRCVARGRVAGTLWADSATDQSNGSLRSALWRLHSLSPGVLIADRASLRLVPSAHVDLRDATELCERLLHPATVKPDDLSADAIGLLSLDLLPGWYDDWVIVEAERWRLHRAHALEALARTLLDEHRNAEAVFAGLAAVECDPLGGSGQAIVIEALAAEGKYVEATRHYRAYRSLLHEELGMEPPLHLQRLLVGHGAP
jgi:SARP family transcriptional regulator, regulator of embCAB operon